MSVLRGLRRRGCRVAARIRRRQIALVQQFNELARRRSAQIALIGWLQLESRGQIPQLYGAVRVAREQVASRSRIQSRRSLALVHTKRRNSRIVHRFYCANAMSGRRQSHEQLIRIGHYFLNEHLMVLFVTEWADVVACRVADGRVERIDGDNFKGGERRRAGLCGDHAPEAGDAPCAHMIVLGADGDEILFGEHHFRYRTAMNRERLK